MNKDIHPDIKKYWENFYGKEVNYYEFDEYSWHSVKATDNPNCFSAYVIAERYRFYKMIDARYPHLKDEDWVYYGFNKTVYDEATTLKIIKLKVFL